MYADAWSFRTGPSLIHWFGLLSTLYSLSVFFTPDYVLLLSKRLIQVAKKSSLGR